VSAVSPRHRSAFVSARSSFQHLIGDMVGKDVSVSPIKFSRVFHGP
jgi:hypothetical protein